MIQARPFFPAQKEGTFSVFLRGPAETIFKHTKIPGEFVEEYVFAGDLFCFIVRTARAVEDASPYDMSVTLRVLSFVSFILNPSFS